MHDLAIFLIGTWCGSLVTVGILALMHAAKDADDFDAELHAYAGEGSVYDQDAEDRVKTVRIRRTP